MFRTPIHILIGELEESTNAPTDVQFATEYDKLEAAIDLEKALQNAGYTNVKRHLITFENFRPILDKIDSDAIVLNLCDGTETDGYPGISVLKAIEERDFKFTGADSAFFEITTSKPLMKAEMIKRGVPTSAFVEFTNLDNLEPLLTKAEDQLGFPMIVKPSQGYASVGITDQSLVWNRMEAREQITHLLKQVEGGVFVEKFLAGREFTALVLSDQNNDVCVFEVLERVFSAKLDPFKRVQTYKRLWSKRAHMTGQAMNGCVLTAPPDETDIVLREHAPPAVQQRCKDLAKEAYIALDGNGYARVDMRSDDLECSKVFVLEVNSMCGISFADSAVGEILKFSNVLPTTFVENLVQFALKRPNRKEKMNNHKLC